MSPRTDVATFVLDLDPDERTEMMRELVDLARVALFTNDWTDYNACVADWCATARVLRDRALTERLLTPGDPADEVPLRRP